MSAFFIRSSVVLGLVFFGAFLGSLLGKPFLALIPWFSAVCAWTLALGFRRALLVVTPFLLLGDTLWDGRLGALFFFGFALSLVTTYVEVRIEAGSSLRKTVAYSFFVALFSFFAITVNFPATQDIPSWEETKLLLSSGFWLLGGALLFYSPLSRTIYRLEAWLDQSYQREMQKIR